MLSSDLFFSQMKSIQSSSIEKIIFKRVAVLMEV
jgi:hypothetical protein